MDGPLEPFRLERPDGLAVGVERRVTEAVGNGGLFHPLSGGAEVGTRAKDTGLLQSTALGTNILGLIEDTNRCARLVQSLEGVGDVVSAAEEARLAASRKLGAEVRGAVANPHRCGSAVGNLSGAGSVVGSRRGPSLSQGWRG